MKSKVITTQNEVLGAVAHCLSNDLYKQTKWVEENKNDWVFSETIKGYSGDYCALPIFLILGFRYNNKEKQLCFSTSAESIMEVEESIIDAYIFGDRHEDYEDLDEVVVLMYQSDKGFQKIDYNIGYYEPEPCDCPCCSQNEFAPELTYFEEKPDFNSIPEGCIPFVELPYIWEFEYNYQNNNKAEYFIPKEDKFEIHKFKNVNCAFREAKATLFHDSDTIAGFINCLSRVKLRNRWFEFYIDINFPEGKENWSDFDDFEKHIKIEGGRIPDDEQYWW